MQQVELTNHQELLERIHALRIEKLEKESVLKEIIKETIDSFDQMKLIKGYIQEIASDNEIKSNLTKIGVNIGVKFLLKKFFSPKENESQEEPSGYLVQLKRSLIQNAAPKVAVGIQNFLEHRNRQNTGV